MDPLHYAIVSPDGSRRLIAIASMELINHLTRQPRDVRLQFPYVFSMIESIGNGDFYCKGFGSIKTLCVQLLNDNHHYHMVKSYPDTMTLEEAYDFVLYNNSPNQNGHD